MLATQSCPDGVEGCYLKLEGAVTPVVGKVHNIASKRNALWSFMCVCVCVCVCTCLVYSSGAQVQLGLSFGIHWFPDDKTSISKWNISIMFKLLTNIK